VSSIQNAKRSARLKALRSGGNMIPPEEAKRINQAYEYNVKMWRSRKRKVSGWIADAPCALRFS